MNHFVKSQFAPTLSWADKHTLCQSFARSKKTKQNKSVNHFREANKCHFYTSRRDLIGCQSGRWVCLCLGIVGGWCSHSISTALGGRAQGTEGGSGCCDIHATHMAAAEQVRTWRDSTLPLLSHAPDCVTVRTHAHKTHKEEIHTLL